jgi:hypothetical protein
MCDAAAMPLQEFGAHFIGLDLGGRQEIFDQLSAACLGPMGIAGVGAWITSYMSQRG